jgi:hypothetical protein
MDMTKIKHFLLLASVLLAVLAAPAVAVGAELTKYTIFDYSAADSGSIVASRTFDDQVAHGAGSRVNCNASVVDGDSFCYFQIDIFQHVPATAKAVRLLVKAKAWNMSGPSYCLLYSSVNAGSPDGNNHFIHVEDWSTDSAQRRRVTYSTIDAHIIGNGVTLEVGREISGDCTVDFVVYLEGYWE